MLKVEPNVERRFRRNSYRQTKSFQTFENVVSLVLEMSLQRKSFLLDMLGIEQGDGCKLKAGKSCIMSV